MLRGFVERGAVHGPRGESQDRGTSAAAASSPQVDTTGLKLLTLPSPSRPRLSYTLPHSSLSTLISRLFFGTFVSICYLPITFAAPPGPGAHDAKHLSFRSLLKT